MSGYALLKSVIVPSASVAWAHEYQMTSPSFLAAGRILLFHSAMAAWYFAGEAVASAGAAAGGLACARTGFGAEPEMPNATRIPPTTTAHRRTFIALSLRSRPGRRRHAARPAPRAATREDASAHRGAAGDAPARRPAR